jgi:NAD-dependent SIR2 family protein deacetylase
MVTETPQTLGACSECDAEIPHWKLLLRYETTAGGPAMWAECPACGEVVHPQNKP